MDSERRVGEYRRSLKYIFINLNFSIASCSTFLGISASKGNFDNSLNFSL